jgi:RNA polymerase sigma-70 factor (ECF subfamily)
MWLLWAVIDRSGASRWAESRALDADAIERATRGDQTALADLYDRHARPIYSLALRILRDAAEAEDIVQDVFTQAWRQASRYDAARGGVAAWLLNLARSRAIDRLRARRARPESPFDRPPDDIISTKVSPPDLETLQREQIDRVRLALGALPLVQRVAIELAYYEGLTHAEIAAELEQPIGTVKTRIRLGMIKLRDALGGMG